MRTKKRVLAVLVCIMLECSVLADYSISSWATFYSNARNVEILAEEEQDKWPIATDNNASLNRSVIGEQ